MLTGPVTILNWSFPREDIPIKDEVLDLEATGVKIIQIDEAALRESCRSVAATGMKTIWTGLFRPSVWSTLPLHRIRRSIPTCATQSLPILSDNMDADVISFEASRSNLEILDELKGKNFQTEVGPGVYDIHSPRVPNEGEIDHTIEAILAKVPSRKVWINPDCGLKTRGITETKASLVRRVEAAKAAREKL